MFCGTENISWNNIHIYSKCEHHLWNIVSPTEHCYEIEECYVVVHTCSNMIRCLDLFCMFSVHESRCLEV